jgi:uncharacterized membrane protein YagU involved in acid resistance
MEQISTANRTQAFVYVLIGGLVVGTLDITYACVFWALKAGVSPQRIFQSVARGVLGAAAFSGGAATAALGLFLHFFIATMMSIAYYLVARRWTALVERPLLFGAVYGVVLWVVMNYIVIPLSAAGGGGSGPPLWVTLSIIVHALLIGVPIALFARKAVASRLS